MLLPSGLQLLISTLPFLLPLSSLASASAIPASFSSITARSPPYHTYSPSSPSGIELTPSTFSETIKEGLWFVEHYSPYCGHCKHFKPTWEQLVMDTRGGEGGGGEVPEVGMGVVDCIVHGDLCEQNNIKGYPTLLMFKDGKIVDQFKKARELDDLKTFMKKHVKATAPPPPPPPPPAADADAAPPAAGQPLAVAKQPPALTLNPNINPTGEVLSLTPALFTSTLASGPTFVKFFAPWCGHCKKLAPTWKQLARHMKGRVNVVEVNCDDHGALCKKEGVQGYPTLTWYAGGGGEEGQGMEYTSGRKLDQLKAFAEKASSAGVQVLAEPSDLDAHVAEEDVLYLLLHSPPDTEILNIIREASSPLLGSPQIFASSDPALHTRYSIPAASPWALVALKDHDAKTPSSIHYGSTPSSLYTTPSSEAPSKLKRWLLTHRLPTSLELTRDTFQSVMNAPQAPLVVLCFSPESAREKVMKRLRDVGVKWRQRTEGSGIVHGREVVFAWMDEGKWKDWMKSMYGLGKKAAEEEGELDGVRVVIADHSKLIYYDTDRAGNAVRFTSSASMFAAVDDAASGKSPFKNSEGTVERIARYLNNKMQSLESFVLDAPFRAFFILIAFFAVAFFVITRLVGADARGAESEWREMKGKNGRLD